MKYTPFIFLIAIISAIIIHPFIHSNESPHPGEIWRITTAGIQGDSALGDSMDVRIVFVDKDNVDYMKLGPRYYGVFFKTDQFMQQGRLVGGPDRVFQDIKADTGNSFWKSAEIGKDSSDSIVVVHSFGTIWSVPVQVYTKRQLDSAYKAGIRKGKQLSISDIYPNEWPPEHAPYYWLQPDPGYADFGELFHHGRNKDIGSMDQSVIDSLISDTLNPL